MFERANYEKMARQAENGRKVWQDGVVYGADATARHIKKLLDAEGTPDEKLREIRSCVDRILVT